MPTNISKYVTRLWRRNYSLFTATSQNLWTPENVVKSPYKDVVIPNTVTTDFIWENLEKWADKTAVVCGITNQSYTYHQLYKNSRNFAVRLRTLFKIRDGDPICMMLSNAPDYSTAVLGILEAGAAVTTMNPIYTARNYSIRDLLNTVYLKLAGARGFTRVNATLAMTDEVHKQLILSDPKLVIASTETLKVMKEAFQLAKMNIPIIIIKSRPNDELPEGTVSFDELIEGTNLDYTVLREVRRNAEDVVLLPYSSGTTGLPKGVELTNRNLVANFLQLNVEGADFYKEASCTDQESILAVLPFYHLYGLGIIMLHKLSKGEKLVTLPKFRPDTFLKAMTDHRISILFTVPPIVLFLTSHPDVKKKHLEHTNNFVCAAAPISIHDIHRLLEKAKPGAVMRQLYGLTETSPVATIEPWGSKNYESSGYAASNTELKIVNPDSQALGPDEVGELWIRGPQVMKAYKNNPEATKNSITEDGWFKSGDLACISKGGSLFIKDRLKELIKVKGHQVPPAELESVLKEHPAVLDAAVIGIPDNRTGEAPRAFVVIKEGETKDETQIKEFVKTRVTQYKWLKEVVFVDSLPRNPSGKILRRLLKDQNV